MGWLLLDAELRGSLNGGIADGEVVKYIHNPRRSEAQGGQKLDHMCPDKAFRTELGINWLLLLLLSHFSSVQLCVTLQTAAHQAPPSLGFSRQEHWSGLPFPSLMHESEK